MKYFQSLIQIYTSKSNKYQNCFLRTRIFHKQGSALIQVPVDQRFSWVECGPRPELWWLMCLCTPFLTTWDHRDPPLLCNLDLISTKLTHWNSQYFDTYLFRGRPSWQHLDATQLRYYIKRCTQNTKWRATILMGSKFKQNTKLGFTITRNHP